MPKRNALPASARRWLPAIADVAVELHRRGWAEANAGNFSVRLAAEGGGRSARLTLLVKRAGARMREIARDPEPVVCVVEVAPSGSVIGTSPAGAVPTSELPSHVAVHAMLLRRRPEHVAVLHTHPTATIALSLLVPEPRELVSTLARMHAEGPLLLRDRVTAVRFGLPGTEELARATASALRAAAGVIWPMHGMVATGPDLAAALDLIEVADKCAAIALAVGPDRLRRSGLSLAQEIAIRDRRP